MQENIFRMDPLPRFISNSWLIGTAYMLSKAIHISVAELVTPEAGLFTSLGFFSYVMRDYWLRNKMINAANKYEDKMKMDAMAIMSQAPPGAVPEQKDHGQYI